MADHAQRREGVGSSKARTARKKFFSSASLFATL